MIMKQTQVKISKQTTRRPAPQDADRRSPSGRTVWSN
jgi:hypothetical protein